MKNYKKISWPVLLLMISALAGCTANNTSRKSEAPVNVKIIAFNDFHGYLKRSDNAELFLSNPDRPGEIAQVKVGGVAYLATLVKQLKEQNSNSIVVAAGDLVGGSPFISAFTQDEATVSVLSQIGLEVSAVGNHEFDKGKAEVLRLQNGGCAPGKVIGSETCIKNGAFQGAQYKLLAANVINDDTGKRLFPATYTKKFGDATVGFIGITLKGAPEATRGAGGLTFLDEAEVINSQVVKLKEEGVDAVVVLIHQGGSTSAVTINDKSCPALAGEILPIVNALKNVDVVVSAHTHREYVCHDRKTGVLLTQANYYGNVVTDIDLSVVPGKGVISKSANSIPVITDQNKDVPRGYRMLTKDKEIDAEVQFYDDLSKQKSAVILGYTATALPAIDIEGSNVRNNNAEHLIGDVIADAFLASVPREFHADIAVINPGGVRSGLNRAGPVTYDDLFSILPFGNNLFYTDLTGEQIIRMLEQQWEQQNCRDKPLTINKINMCGRLLQPSATLSYTWDVTRGPGKPAGKGDLVLVESVRIGANHEPIDLKKIYRVVSLAFLSEDGGDNFGVFKDGKNLQDLGAVDIDVVSAYFSRYSKNAPLPKPVRRISCPTCPAIY